MSEITASAIEKAFGSLEDRDWYYRGQDYPDLVGLFCDEIVVEASDNDCQGDTYAILRKGDEYGYLEFGWGSCSGCDALQACESDEDMARLANDLAASVEWQADREAFKVWVAGKDWHGGYSWHCDGFHKFAEKVRTAGLGNIPEKDGEEE